MKPAAQRSEGDGATGRRATQANVAKHAGVSAAIVSSVLNNRQYGNIRISESTRQRVLESVRELGYSPNIAARNLAGGSNKLVGVFTWQRLFPLNNEDFFYEFLVGIEEASEDAGYNLLMLTAAKDSAGSRSIFPDGANGLQLADGGILLGWDEKSDQIRRLDAEGYPFVFVGERHIEGVELSYVAADYVSGTAEIVGRLIGHGHRRIGMINNGNADEPVPGRRAGFQSGIARHADAGLSAHVAAMDDASHRSARALRDPEEALGWILDNGITGLIVEDSVTAVRIRDTARLHGLQIPRDLSLVGLSGTPEIGGVADLTELSIPRREMGRESVQLLLQLLADPKSGPARTTIPCGIREAGTLAAAPATPPSPGH